MKTKGQAIRAQLQDINPDALLADGFDDALIGIASRPGLGPVALYDVEACRAVLINEGQTEADAEEYPCFNVLGSWVGEGTPLFADLWPDTPK